jgi:hypothetical protein
MARKHRQLPRYEKETERAKLEAERLKAAQARAEKAKSRIQADLSRQAPNNSYGGGKLYYEDLELPAEAALQRRNWRFENLICETEEVVIKTVITPHEWAGITRRG